MRVTATTAILITLAFPEAALAWGASGHSIIAEIAQRRLSASAAANVENLIGHASLASISSWADDYKFTSVGSKTKRWHFVDFDIAEENPSTAEACKLESEGDCLILALNREVARLADPALPPLARQNSLRFVVHLMGDLSQPFHCSEHAGDGGGNGVKVDFVGKYPDGKEAKFSGNLHKLWDDILIEAHAFSWGAYLEEIETTVIPNLAVSDQRYDHIFDWAKECHQVGRRAYAMLPAGWESVVGAGGPIALDAKYQQSVQGTLDQQLAIGGLRLAAVLNKALGSK
ncbi:S1/P1 nuclease [Mesorhizobium sp. AR10]|uniref:S1/P1 nuclease n=1 Tax=Mesorhizobium sp. AR10 TaxID=2865839 RepID=UPI002160A599|nr:S1/P1 nuclease [Mesorhizobium sp. AR10]UVK38745.1 S1/P1 nuclease [Mesorhizobium sp. AR10]